MKFTNRLISLYVILLCVLAFGIIIMLIVNEAYKTYEIVVAGKITGWGILLTILFKFILNFLAPITAVFVSIMYLKDSITVWRVLLVGLFFAILTPVVINTVYLIPEFLNGSIPFVGGLSDPQGYIRNFPYLGASIEAFLEFLILCLISAIIIAMSIKIKALSWPKR